MNHIYRVIFNAATQTWQAVSELAKAGGKRSLGANGAAAHARNCANGNHSQATVGAATRYYPSLPARSPLCLAVLGVLMLGVSAPSAVQAADYIGAGGGGGRGNSSSSSNSGSGGGGGGSAGYRTTANMTNADTIHGGGGGGGGWTAVRFGGGGGGGAGLIIDGSGITFSNSGRVYGGGGGNGGGGTDGFGGSSGGGNGGTDRSGSAATAGSNGSNGTGGFAGSTAHSTHVALFGSGGGGSSVNSGGTYGAGANGEDVRTGKGGSGGWGGSGGYAYNKITIAGMVTVASGGGGHGGAGIVANSGNTTIINSGQIYGGCAGRGHLGYTGSGSGCRGGTLRANAIIFYGGGNTLELRADSDIKGNVVGVNTSNTLALGGATNDSFDVSQIGAAAQYQAFGTFVKKGTSTWTLTGSTTASTPWAIDGGVLSVSADNNLGAAAGGLRFDGGTLQATDTFSMNRATTLNAGGGTIDVAATKTLTQNGGIGGSGGLNKTGAGRLVLGGANGYAGATHINAGIVNANSASALGNNSAVTVAAGAGLDLGSGLSVGSLAGAGAVGLHAHTLTTGGDHASTLYSGVMSGTGGLVKTGTGTFSLTGANSYSGGTTVSGGVLSGNSTSLQGDIVNNATVVFNQATAGTYAGNMSGTGGVNKTGSGVLHFTGNHVYSGATNINAGTLQVNGSIANSATTVNNGGTIGGSGTVGNLIVNSGGTAAPGDAAIGTLTVRNNVTLNNATYRVRVDAAGNSDNMVANGTAAINGGTVDVRVGSGNYNAATRYTILTANGVGGVSGTFANATSDMAFLEPVLTYDPNNVYLNLNRNNRYFADLANSFNQRQVAAMLDNTATGNPVLQAVVQLNASQARQAYDDVSGEIHNSVHASIINDTQLFSQAMQTHKTAQGSQLWGQLIGQHGTWQADGNAHELERNSVGAVFGYDLPVSGNWTLGLAAGFGHNQYEVDAVHSTAKANQVHIGAYAGRDWKLGDNTLTLRLNSGYTLSDIDVTRQVNIGQSLNNTLTSDYQVHTVQLGGELGYAIPVGNTTIKPYAGLDFVSSRRTGLEESGGAAALSSAAHTSNNAFARTGVRLEKTFGNSGSRLYADMGVRHAMKDTHVESTHQFVGGGNAFKVRGNSSGKTVGIVNIGMNYQLTPAAKLTLNANVAVGSGYKDYGAHIGFRWDF